MQESLELELPAFGITGWLKLAAAIGGKIIGAGLGARLTGFPSRKAFVVGVSSIPRMEIALVSLLIAIRAYVIEDDRVKTMVAATTVLVAVTTLLTPILVRTFYREIE